MTDSAKGRFERLIEFPIKGVIYARRTSLLAESGTSGRDNPGVGIEENVAGSKSVNAAGFWSIDSKAIVHRRIDAVHHRVPDLSGAVQMRIERQLDDGVLPSS